MSVRERIMSVPVAEHTRAACAQITSQTELRHLHYSPTSSFQSVFLFSPHDFEYSLSKNKWMIKKKSQNESVYVRINLWEAESANIFNQLKHLNINPVSNVLIKNTEDTQRVVEVVCNQLQHKLFGTIILWFCQRSVMFIRWLQFQLFSWAN